MLVSLKKLHQMLKALKSAIASALLGSLKDVVLVNTVQLVAKPSAVQLKMQATQ